jgi:hypothetical protein
MKISETMVQKSALTQTSAIGKNEMTASGDDTLAREAVTPEMIEAAQNAVWNTDTHEYKRDYLMHDHIMRAALEAAWTAARPASEAGWQPIEDAPRDGSEIILGVIDSNTEGCAGFYDSGSERYGHRGTGPGWFAECDRGNILTASAIPATHWKPMPAGPNAQPAPEDKGDGRDGLDCERCRGGGCEYCKNTGRATDTGNIEADRLIDRLMSSDPDFKDCIDAAVFIRKLVVEHSGPDGFPTWKDAAIAEKIKAKTARSEGRRQGLELAANEGDKYAQRRACSLSEQVSNKALGATEVAALIRALASREAQP